MGSNLTFPYKGYGRIFVQNKYDIQRVKDIIRKMDDFEYDYLPSDLITSDLPKVCYHEDGSKYLYVDLVYTHKFSDLDLNVLQLHCLRNGISMMCWIGGSSEYCDFEIIENVLEI